MNLQNTRENIDDLITFGANNEEGNLHLSDGVVCDKCKNRGSFYETRTDEYGLPVLYVVQCDCMNKRNIIRKAQQSGLGKALEACTFDKYNATEPWQKTIKEKAVKFTEDQEHKWFAICGMSGAGKTHICTAISNFYIQQGYKLHYMLWRNECDKLKQERVHSADEYDRHLSELKNVKVLYIDDLFKTGYAQNPSAADVGIAFDIFNHRYINDMITIISSERGIEDINDIDAAIGGRIYEKTEPNGYYIGIQKDINKNYRINGQKKSLSQTH